MAKGEGRKREFGQLIPQEDSDSKICYKLEIPNTSAWRIILHSLVLLLTTGRYWKRTKTGRRIDNVQDTGWEIYNTLRVCDSAEDDGEQIIINIVKNEVCCMSDCGCRECNEVVLPVRNESDLFGDDLGDFIPPDEQPVLPVDLGFNEWGCKCTKHAWVLMKEAIFGMSSFRDAGGVTVTQGEEFVRGVFQKVYGGVFERLWILYSQLVYYVMQFVSVLVASRLNNWIDNNLDQLIVDVFCATSVLDAGTRVVSTIRNTSELNLIEKFVMVVWASMYPYEGVFQSPALRLLATDHDIILSDYADDCICAAVVENPLPNLPPEYVEVSMLINAVEGVLNGGTVLDSGNRWCFQGQGNSVVTVSTVRPQFLGNPVPDANIAGFHFHLVFESIVNADDFGHNEQNTSTHVSSVAFGATAGDWLVDEKFVGAENLEASLQAWLSSEVFRREDNDAKTKDHNVESEFSWVFYGGSTNAGDINEAVIDCTWIINTTGL